MVILACRCAAVAALASIAAASPVFAGADQSPVGGPRKRVAVTDVEVKIGGLIAGTPVPVNVRTPSPRDKYAAAARPAVGSYSPGSPQDPYQQPNPQPYQPYQGSPPTSYPAGGAAPDPYQQPGAYPAANPYQQASSSAYSNTYQQPATSPSANPYQQPSPSANPYQQPSANPAPDPYQQPGTTPGSNPYSQTTPGSSTSPYQQPATVPSPGGYPPAAAANPAANPYQAPATPQADPYQQPGASAASIPPASSGPSALGLAGGLLGAGKGAGNPARGSTASAVLGFAGSPGGASSGPPAKTTTMTTQSPDALPTPEAFGTGLTEMLVTALVKTERFLVLERKDLQAMRSEQALGADSIASANFAAKAGKLLGAQALVRAVVTEYGTRASASGVNSSYLRGVDLKQTSNTARVVIDIRLFDAETGQILAADRAEGSSSSSGVGLEVVRKEGNLGHSWLGETPLGRAARDAIDKSVQFVVARLDAVPWRGRVADVDAGPDGNVSALYVNAGSRIGLRTGDVLEIYELGRTVVDPDTGAVIGQTGGITGRCRLKDVNPDMSVAVPVTGSNFQKGAQVRFLSRG